MKRVVAKMGNMVTLTGHVTRNMSQLKKENNGMAVPLSAQNSEEEE